MPSIGGLPALLQQLDEAARTDVAGVFRIEESIGLGEVPETFRPKVAQWCSSGSSGGDASEAWRKVEAQQVVSVHNFWTFETANFNVLRACRPVVAAPGPSGCEGPDEIAAACEGPGRCDFCELEKLTCVEPFGRVVGEHSMTAGNAFKSAGVHGLVVWNRHRPNQLTTEEVADGFRTADAWLDRAVAWSMSEGRRSVHPVMFWNSFKSAGASQIHPHMQLQLFSAPVAHGALLEEQCRRYRHERNGGDLCHDIVRAHRHLGLSRTFGDGDDAGHVWGSLTPRVGGGELCALGPVTASPGRPRLGGLAVAVAAILRAFRRRGVEGISITALLVPVQDGMHAWLVRCHGRGRAQPSIVDAGSSELVGLTTVGSDPYMLFAALQLELGADADVPATSEAAK